MASQHHQLAGLVPRRPKPGEWTQGGGEHDIKTATTELQNNTRELPPSGNGADTIPTTQRAWEEPLLGKLPPFTPVARHTSPTHLSYGQPKPARGHNGPSTYHHPAEVTPINRFSSLQEQASSAGRDSEALSSGILKEGTMSITSGSKSSKGRDPVPITPDILHFLDRLELK